MKKFFYVSQIIFKLIYCFMKKNLIKLEFGWTGKKIVSIFWDRKN